MSEKYSTDWFVAFIKMARLHDGDCYINEDTGHAIIARLRAADKLCEAAKRGLSEVTDAIDKVTGFGEGEESRPWLPVERELRKAIAEYEGKP